MFHTLVDLAVLALSIFLLRGPGGEVFSATGLVALLFGLLAFTGLYYQKKKGIIIRTNTLTTIVLTVIILGIVSLFTSGVFVAKFAPALGRNSTLTDRVGVWNMLYPEVLKRPLVGIGHGSFWTVETRIKYDISEGHSGYLDVLLEKGFIGIFLISGFLVASCRKAHWYLLRDPDWGILWITFILVTVLHNITESSLHSFTSQLAAILIFMAISSSKEYFDLGES